MFRRGIGVVPDEGEKNKALRACWMDGSVEVVKSAKQVRALARTLNQNKKISFCRVKVSF